VLFVTFLLAAFQMGVFANLAPPESVCHAHLDGHIHSDCGQQSPAARDDHGGHPDGDDCPGGDHHHHHGCCMHGVSMAYVSERESKLLPPCSVALGMVIEHERVPDAPFCELDKPPLI